MKTCFCAALVAATVLLPLPGEANVPADVRLPRAVVVAFADSWTLRPSLPAVATLDPEDDLDERDAALADRHTRVDLGTPARTERR